MLFFAVVRHDHRHGRRRRGHGFRGAVALYMPETPAVTLRHRLGLSHFRAMLGGRITEVEATDVQVTDKRWTAFLNDSHSLCKGHSQGI